MLSFQSENLLFTPLLNDFLSIVQDFAFSSFFLYLLPILILAHFSRSFIYFFAVLVSSLFMDSAAFIGLVFLPLAFYIETTFIVIIA